MKKSMEAFDRILVSSLQSAVVDSLVEFDNLEQCRKQFRVLGREDQVSSAPDANSTKPNLRLHANLFLPPPPHHPPSQIPFYCHYDVTLVLLPKPGVTNSTIGTYPSSQTILYCSTTDNVAVCAHVQVRSVLWLLRCVCRWGGGWGWECVCVSDTLLTVSPDSTLQRSNFSNVIRFIPGLKYSSLHADVPTVAGIGSESWNGMWNEDGHSLMIDS